MKAVRFHEYGGPEVLRHETVPDPEPGPGEVAIRVRACAVNHLDLDLRDGVSRIPLDLPFVPGLEIAGEVADLGDGVDGYRVGDRVTPMFYYACLRCDACRKRRENLCPERQMFGVTRPGGYAERVIAPAASLLRIPDGVSDDAAAATQVAFGTAFHMLVTRGGAEPGEVVLVQGAGSGVGSAAIQIARSRGLEVIATAGSDAKLERARGLGAAKTVNYRTQELEVEVMRHTSGRGVDLVFEHIGGDVFTRSVRCLATRGRLVTCGAHGGELPEIDVIELFRKEASVIGSYTTTPFELRQVLLLVELGKVEPVVHRSLPLADAAEAHRVIAAREQFGKVILNP